MEILKAKGRLNTPEGLYTPHIILQKHYYFYGSAQCKETKQNKIIF